jgi:hypothetical protein
MSMIHLPKSTPLDGNKLVERSLDSFYRSKSDGALDEGDCPVEVQGPNGHDGLVRGWVADGIAVNAFNFSPEAFENSQTNTINTPDSTVIGVVVNDKSMISEPPIVMETYRNRAEELDIQVEFSDNTSCNELAEILEGRRDFVHFIGHCEPEGLCCVDGHLSPTTLSKSSVRTFLLNACRSFEFGYGLIQKGSVAGAVTLGSVLDGQAMKVGSNFARLLMLGFTMERSLVIERNNAILGRV